MDFAGSLSNQFLIAMPGMPDPNFNSTVTLICEHNADGALGIVINRPLNLKLGGLFSQLDVKDASPNPTTFSGRSKLAGTRAVIESCVAHEVKGLVARLFTVYGPGEHDGRLLPSLVAAVDADGEVALTEGLQKRDFTYAGDVARGLALLGTCTTEPGQVVNLATGNLLTVREFIERAGPVLGIDPSRLRFGAVPTRDDEMEHREVSVAKLRGLIGWSPDTPVADGVRAARAFGDTAPSGADGV
jgi:nucleoside-diphosphate-sugar epimerase